MNKFLLSNVASVALATIGVAQAAGRNDCPKQLAANGLPGQNTAKLSVQLAASGQPTSNTANGSQLEAVDPSCQN